MSESLAALPRAIPSYETLINALNTCPAQWMSMIVRLEQLGALLKSIRRDAEEGSATHTLADLGMEIIERTLDAGGEASQLASTLATEAQSAFPKRAWRKCGFPSAPDADERAEEEAFARAITGFPKRGGWDDNYTLVCVANAPDGEA